jgi:hypothetical protein
MDACPVSCIHWVDKADLPALEFVVRYKVRRRRGAGRGGSIMPAHRWPCGVAAARRVSLPQPM